MLVRLLGDGTMQSQRAHLISAPWIGCITTVDRPDPITLDDEKVERGARALFEFVFARTGQNQWAECDDKIKAGFRSEVRAVLEAIWPQG